MSASEVKALTALFAAGTEAGGLFRTMAEALPVAIYMTDSAGRLTYFNDAAIKLSGGELELGAAHWCMAWKLFLPDGAPLPYEECPIALALKGESALTGIECMAERPDGTRFWFTPYSAVLRDSEGRITGGIHLLVDITKGKNAKIEANEQFRAIVETTPECVKIVKPDGTLLFMNAPGLALVGAATPEAVIGKSIYDLIAPEDRDRFRKFNERVCGGAKAVLEFDIISLQGVRGHMESHAAPFRHVDGSIVQLAITRNMTRRVDDERASLLLKAIVDSSDDAIISKDLDGTITSWNKSAERIFGYTAKEAIGQSITILIPDDRLDEETNILSRLRRGERVDHFETIRRRKDGALLDVSLTISPVKDAQGIDIGASKIARDVSESKRTERAIRTLNAQLTTDLSAMTRMQLLSTRLMQVEDFPVLLDEILGTGVEITGSDMGNIQLLEDGVLKIAAHRGFGASFLDFFRHVHAGEAACGLAMQSGARVIVEDIVVSPIFAGTPALAVMLGAGVRSVQSTPLVSRGGQVLGIFSTHYRSPRKPGDRELRLMDILARQTADLIERKRAEAALLASEARFRQLADAMPQIVWTTRPDGYCDYFNERWYQFSGFDRHTFGDQGWQPILHPEDLPACREAWSTAIATGNLFNIEYRFWDRQEFRWRWFMSRALPVRDAGGHIVKWFGSSTDIDDQKRVEEDLRRANRDLEQFAFSASHDLQEPLRSIKIYSELLTSSYGERLDSQALAFLSYMRSGATRMEMLVRDLLTYTQVTKFERPLELVDTQQVVSTVLENLAGAISEARAQISVGSLPPLRIHNTHLQQLFQNLIGNAIKYRSPDRTPSVQVTAENRNGQWLFAVKDNGIGIDAEYRERIFGLFKRLHTSDEYSGTGIGLAICQRIVDRYHGRIWVESEPGQGSAFRFVLPV
ncbi:MAG TPA: PAS domain S-box protein [Bryobacteraceae bacterium]|nr:PAS domain S-box protein [Bryobacteraceae bacterium]